MQSLVRKKMRNSKGATQKAAQSEQGEDELQGKAPTTNLFMALKPKGICHKADVKDEMIIFHNENHQKSLDEASQAGAFIASLKACATQKDLQRGSKIHIDLVRTGLLQNNVFVGSTLVSMYAKCGAVEKAQEVFDALPLQNIVTWNALLAGYSQRGCGREALHYFQQMQRGGFAPDAFTFSCILKACASIGAIDKGQEIHDQIVEARLLRKDIVLANALIDMYAKCGALSKAQEVFDELQDYNTVSWNALIAGYAHHGHGKEALTCFEQMQSGDFSPDAVTFVCILKVCSSIGDLDKGQEIHAQILREHILETNTAVANALVDMYAKCGALEKAQELFDELPFRNIVLWTALIAGYAQHGHGEEALTCFEQMQFGGFLPDAVTISCILKACGSIRALEKGSEIHTQIVRECSFKTNIMVVNALIDMYAKCGCLERAQEVFNQLSVQDIVSWTTLIGGYAQHGDGNKALDCFERMQHAGFSPDTVTFACILKACGHIEALAKGCEVHAQIMKEPLLEKSVLIINALIYMYGKCGALERAQEVFDELQNQDVVSWNALLSGYAQYGKNKEALDYFELMQSRTFSPDAATYACILKVCGNIGALDKGQELHAQVIRERLLESNIMVSNGLVDMYVKCGALETAQEVFDELPVRDLILWTALIAGYVEHGCGEEAVACFELMQAEGFYPDAVTFACIMKACGNIGAAYKAQNVHAEIVRHGLLEQDLVVGIALVDMYSNCGMLAEARELFDKLPNRDVVLWSALMAGYAQLGEDGIVLDLFDKMIEEGVEPDTVTFTILLNACAHRGLLDEGQMYFEIILKVFHIIPTLEHYSIMIDLFGRAGHLEKALTVIEELPVTANLTMWHTLLGACRKWANMKLGLWVFEQLHEKDAAAYVCVSNILAAAGSRGINYEKDLISIEHTQM